MAKRMLQLLLIISLVASISWTQASPWAQTRKPRPGKKSITNLEFYFHDTVTGAKPTAVRVAEASGTDKSPTLFGAVVMADDPLTEGPDLSSKLVGRAQGMYGSAGQDVVGLIMMMNYGFVDGIYNGSSFSILSRNSILNPVREMSIVGGTGLFRFARGYALATTYSYSGGAAGDAIVHYNVTLIH